MSKHLSETTRDSIINTAIRLFSERGFHETTVSSIAKEADVGKGTIYWYFESKQQLFEVMVENALKSLYSQMLEYISKRDTPRDQLHLFIKSHMDSFAENKEISRIVLENREGIDASLKAKMLHYAEKHRKELSSIIKRGISDGSFRDINQKYFSYAIMGVIRSFLSLHLEEDVDANRAANFIFDLIVNGIEGKDRN